MVLTFNIIKIKGKRKFAYIEYEYITPKRKFTKRGGGTEGFKGLIMGEGGGGSNPPPHNDLEFNIPKYVA